MAETHPRLTYEIYIAAPAGRVAGRALRPQDPAGDGATPGASGAELRGANGYR